jgi:hypothetical protein
MHFDVDTLIGCTSISRQYKQWFVIKYDTSGNYKWLRLPEPDTISSYSQGSGCFSMTVAPNGISSFFMYTKGSGAFAKGAYNITSSAASPSMHLLKYDANGSFIKGFPMSISEGDVVSLSRLRMAWDYKNDFYYVLSTNGGDPSVSDQPKFGATKMTGTNCLAKFSNTGANLWVKQSSKSSSTGTLSSVPIIDNLGNIYIGTTEENGSNFNGFVTTNLLKGYAVPTVIKINATGTNAWGYNLSSNLGANGYCLSFANNAEVAFAGAYRDTLICGTNKVVLKGTPLNIFFTKFNANTGTLKYFDTIGSAAISLPQVLTSDKNGNFYLGGNFQSRLTVPALSNLNNYGGRNDFFIAKFGVADCKEPVSINENDLQKSIVKIYPNPTQDIITFEALQSDSEVRLFNIMGQQVHSFVAKNNKEQVSINHLASGMYLVQIRNVDGEIYTAKIVKE